MENVIPEKQATSPLSDFNILVPVDTVSRAEHLLPTALSLVGESRNSQIALIGVTPVDPDAHLSEGTLLAQRLRSDLDRLAGDDERIQRIAGSVVSHKPWDDIEDLIEGRLEDRDLLLLPWQPDTKYLRAHLGQILNNPPCNVAIVKPAVQPSVLRRILLPVRGGPFANLSLQLAVRLARASNAEITLLRVISSDDDSLSQVLREKFTGLSDTFPEITAELQIVGDAGTAILRALKEHQAVILGASAVPDGSPIGIVASLILQRGDITTVLVKTKEPFRLPIAPVRSNLPVLVRVEKWSAENTFHSREFADIGRLVDLKKRQELRISVGLPALNHEATIGTLISSIKSSLMDDAPLIDEIVLIDGNSSDHTRKIAAELGVTPYIHQQTLPGLGTFRGKGEALWKSLYLSKGDLIVWVDPDIANPHPRFIYGIVGPLLMDSRIQFVKGFYRRLLREGDSQAAGEGKVTEFLARPIINLFFPELSGMVQPLAGIYGGRRSALEQLPFYAGHGVEIGLLFDLLERFGLKAIAQVDLEEIVHQKQSITTLSRMSFAILQVFAEHLSQRGIIDSTLQIERTMKMLRADGPQFHLEEMDVHEQKRPPMIEVKPYLGRHPLRRNSGMLKRENLQ